MDDSLENFLTTGRDKTHEKKFESLKLGSKLELGFCYFLEISFLVFLHIVLDCSLGQCLTSNRAETSKKNFVAQTGAEMIFSILMSSSLHSNLLVLTNVIYNASLHRWYTTRNNNFLTKYFAVVSGLCDDKSQNKIAVAFCSNSYGWKMKFSIMGFFTIINLQFLADLVNFTEKILNEKLHFLCSVNTPGQIYYYKRFPNFLEFSGQNAKAYLGTHQISMTECFFKIVTRV